MITCDEWTHLKVSVRTMPHNNKRNRRTSPRVPISIAVKKKMEQTISLCQAGDISAHGIFLASALPSQTGQSLVEIPAPILAPKTPPMPPQRCWLEFSLPNSDVNISARGIVVRQIIHRRYQLFGIQFYLIAPSHRRLIQRYVENPSFGISLTNFFPTFAPAR